MKNHKRLEEEGKAEVGTQEAAGEEMRINGEKQPYMIVYMYTRRVYLASAQSISSPQIRDGVQSQTG